MAYKALYRTWRPQKFSEVIGQEHIVQTLRNAVARNKIAHAYLFAGPRGTGKTSMAKIVAKAVNCENPVAGEPCNQCATCRSIQDGTIVDILEIDAASNRGVDEIRELRDKVKYVSSRVKYKVYIIDEVHMLTTEAFNALLKTLEEPPSHVIFILATTEMQKLPLTIISRCQRFNFHSISVESIVDRLQHIADEEKLIVERNALYMIAKYANGGMRDALSVLDQLSMYQQKITTETVFETLGLISFQFLSEIVMAIKEEDGAKILQLLMTTKKSGKNNESILAELINYLRNMLYYKLNQKTEETELIISSDPLFVGLSEAFTEQQLIVILETLNQGNINLKKSEFSEAILEVTILKVLYLEKGSNVKITTNDLREINELKERVKSLEKKIKEVKRNVDLKTVNKEVNQSLNLLEQLYNMREDLLFTKLKDTWLTITQDIKKKKITLHAWLMNGEPVFTTKNEVIIAFRNTMHKETIEREENKKIIEDVIFERLGEKMHLVAVMKNDWDNFINETDNVENNEEDYLVSKAYEIFGDLVEIKD